MTTTRARAGGTTVLDRRALNRATLARQLLLTRAELPVPAAVHRLGGLNAQEPNSPYVSLWSRLAGFGRDDLTERIVDRAVVRATLFRGTQHLVTDTDFSWLYPVLRPLLARMQRNTFGRRTAGIDLDELLDAARALLAGRILTRPELGRLLAGRWPDHDRMSLAWSVQYLEPILHPAPSGTWNTRGHTPFELATDVLGPPDPDPAPASLVRAYLGAYGPATIADIRTWSGVSGLREVVEEMGSELLSFTDETGRRLFDLPDAPRPAPDVPAPVRFLPEFDNLMLAHRDRTRVLSEQDHRRVCSADHVAATLLLDGVVQATWAITRDGGTALLTVEPFRPLGGPDRAAIAAEGDRLLELVAGDDADREVRILTPR